MSEHTKPWGLSKTHNVDASHLPRSGRANPSHGATPCSCRKLRCKTSGLRATGSDTVVASVVRIHRNRWLFALVALSELEDTRDRSDVNYFENMLVDDAKEAQHTKLEFM